MESSPITSTAAGTARTAIPMRYGRPDTQLADALTKVSPAAQKKARASSEDFEAVFSEFDVFADDLEHQGRRPVWRHRGHRRMALDADRPIFQTVCKRPAASEFRTTSFAPSFCSKPTAPRKRRRPRMNRQPQRQPVAAAPAAPPRAASTPAEARKLAESLMDTMNNLLAVIERETELVRAGKVREAIQLEEQEKRVVAALHRHDHAAQAEPEISGANDARSAVGTASPPRRVSRHAAGQPDRAGNRARGIRRHRARRQHRDPAAQHSADLHRGRTARPTRATQHDADRGEPLGFEINGQRRLTSLSFESNRRIDLSIEFNRMLHSL